MKKLVEIQRKVEVWQRGYIEVDENLKGEEIYDLYVEGKLVDENGDEPYFEIINEEYAEVINPFDNTIIYRDGEEILNYSN